MPTVRERIGLAVRQNPLRGVGILLLLLLALAFLVITVLTFPAVEWLVILGAGVVLIAVVLAVISAVTVVTRSRDR